MAIIINNQADTLIAGGVPVSGGYILIQDQKSTGSAGGTFTSGSYQTRVLNTLVNASSIAGVSLSSNQFTLPAGTYRVRAEAPAYRVDRHVIRLQNITDNTTVLTGGNQNAQASTATSNTSTLWGRFTITTSKTFALQHRCQTTLATDGLGISTASVLGAAYEVFATVELIKE